MNNEGKLEFEDYELINVEYVDLMKESQLNIGERDEMINPKL